jgi:aminopeptidase N
MENWGLLLLDEARVFRDPATDSSAYKKFLMVDVVCHEAAHQWIGNLVTCPDWMQVWHHLGRLTLEHTMQLFTRSPAPSPAAAVCQ